MEKVGLAFGRLRTPKRIVASFDVRRASQIIKTRFKTEANVLQELNLLPVEIRPE